MRTSSANDAIGQSLEKSTPNLMINVFYYVLTYLPCINFNN